MSIATRKPDPRTSAGETTPAEIEVSTYPTVCTCKLCNMDYCDCSEEGQGTVKHSEEYWEK